MGQPLLRSWRTKRAPPARPSSSTSSQTTRLMPPRLVFVSSLLSRRWSLQRSLSPLPLLAKKGAGSFKLPAKEPKAKKPAAKKAKKPAAKKAAKPKAAKKPAAKKLAAKKAAKPKA